MDNFLFANVRKLYENELYGSVLPAASLLATLLKNDRAACSPDLEFQLQLFLGNSYYMERQFRQSLKHLDAALLLRKVLARYKNSQLSVIERTYEHFNEMEIRFRLAFCYRELGEHNMAIATIQAVPAKNRTPKLNMLLAQMLHSGRAANVSEAMAAYKDVLQECPMAMEAMEALLELGIDGAELNSLVLNATNASKNTEWLSSWIKAHAQMYSRKHLEAAKSFQHINENSKFHQNEHLLTLIGKCFYYYGSFAQAQHYLETAVMVNPQNMQALMCLVVVYEYNQKPQELDKIIAQFNNINEFSSEHWFVLAQSFYSAGKIEKASSFTHKAISVNGRNIEAHLLRGKICLQLKRFKDAIYFFRAAQCIANYRFEVYKGLFHCYVGLKRYKEAQTMCALAVRHFRNSPRSYVMFARTLFHSSNPVAKKNTKKFVSRALEIDEHYAPAVALMAEVCQSEGETQEAIALLKKQVVNYPHHKLFTMLGDILSGEKDLNGALEYYTIALSMEPTYHRALEGVSALGQASTRTNTKQEPDAAMPTASAVQDEEWPIECEEPPSIEAVELSSPAVLQEDAESDTFSDPFWQDVDGELTN